MCAWGRHQIVFRSQYLTIYVGLFCVLKLRQVCVHVDVGRLTNIFSDLLFYLVASNNILPSTTPNKKKRINHMISLTYITWGGTDSGILKYLRYSNSNLFIYPKLYQMILLSKIKLPLSKV
jgi:hypothetical protein